MLLKISQNSQENTCARVSFLIKLQAETCNFILKKETWHRCFPVNFAKFKITPFTIVHLWWLLLEKNMHLTVCYYHVTYAFQIESTLYSCLIVKELLSRNRRHIWNLSDSNGIWTHTNLVHKRTLNRLAKLAKFG